MENRDDYPIILQPEKEKWDDYKQFDLPAACVFNLQQIALTDDEMVKEPGAAERYRFIARHILELFKKKEHAYTEKELASLKEVVRELIPIAERMYNMCEYRGKGDYSYKKDADKYKPIIDRAKRISDNK